MGVGRKMASVEMLMEVDCPVLSKGEGLRQYYVTKIEELQLVVAEKAQNLRRLQAQRNELNAKVRMLREELQLLQEQGSYVGEVVKAMDKKRSLLRCIQKASLWWTLIRISTSMTLNQTAVWRSEMTAILCTKFCPARWILWYHS